MTACRQYPPGSEPSQLAQGIGLDQVLRPSGARPPARTPPTPEPEVSGTSTSTKADSGGLTWSPARVSLALRRDDSLSSAIRRPGHRPVAGALAWAAAAGAARGGAAGGQAHGLRLPH